MRRKRFKGKATPPRISYYLSEGGDVQALLAATKTLFDNITGVEDEWAEAALPVHFPPVHNSRSAVRATEVVGMEKGDCRATEREADVDRCPHYTRFKVQRPTDDSDWRCRAQCHPCSGSRVCFALTYSNSMFACSCNSAIGDSKMLNMALDEAGGDIDAATQKFNDLRYEEIQSAQELQEVRQTGDT